MPSSSFDLGFDGHADIVGYDDVTDELVWRIGNGHTGFPAPFGNMEGRHAAGFDARSVGAGDLDGDGRREVVLIDQTVSPGTLVVIDNVSPEI
ncbi:MAG: VCBS repeat-containing protein [Acidimicrobiales bacterium]